MRMMVVVSCYLRGGWGGVVRVELRILANVYI
jgi:hypothetical protein